MECNYCAWNSGVFVTLHSTWKRVRPSMLPGMACPCHVMMMPHHTMPYHAHVMLYTRMNCKLRTSSFPPFHFSWLNQLCAT